MRAAILAALLALPIALTFQQSAAAPSVQQVTNTPGVIIQPPRATATPRVPTRTPTTIRTRTATPTRHSPTPSITNTLTATASPTITPTAAVPWPTLPGFAILTPTPIIDVFDVPLDVTGPIPSPTLGQVAAPEPVPDLIAVDIEVTQGMQDLDNDMPLVADRITYVRLYVKTDGADYLNVKGLLLGTHDGDVLGVIPADNQPITAQGDGGNRINPDDSLYFGLPWSWFEEGTLDLEAFVYAGDPDAPFDFEPESDNNFIETSVEFEPGAPINVSFVQIHLHENYDGNQPEKLFTQQEPGFWAVVIGMLRYMPLPGFQLYAPPVDKIYCGLPSGEAGIFEGPGPVGEHGNCEFDLQIPGGAQYVTQMMALVDSLTDDATEDLHYYGMVHSDFDPQMTFFNSQGNALSYTGLALNGQAYGQMDSAPDATVPWYSTGAMTLAHELGHRTGLSHVECAGNEELGGGIDEDYPWPAPNCSLANVNDEGFFGFDVWYEVLPGTDQPTVISNDPSVADPNKGFPLMGYQKEQYGDAYSWCIVLQMMGVDCDPATVPVLASIGAPRRARLAFAPLASADLAWPALQSAGPFLLVSGSVQLDPVEASLGFVLTLPEPPADLHQYPDSSTLDTGFEVALLDAGGRTLASQPIDQTTINHDTVNTIPFLTGLPLEPGTARLAIRRGGETLAERVFSPNIPSVDLLTPNGGEAFTSPFEIRWQASDADGDALTYTLQYSPDGGESWQALAIGLTDDVYQVLSPYNLTGSEQAKIRVLASDGANTAVDESDGVFSVPNTPPLPAIRAPGHLADFPAGARVPLSGSATDREDGVLSAEALTWESSLDGFLGTGDRLEPSDLSPGYHVLTLTAEDGQGLAGQAHVGITVDPSLARDIPGEEELALASQILAAGPEWSGGSNPTSVFLIGLAVVAGIALVGLILIVPLVRSWMRR
jgi:hypothetical protein